MPQVQTGSVVNIGEAVRVVGNADGTDVSIGRQVIAGEDLKGDFSNTIGRLAVEERYLATNITSNATTTVKSGHGKVSSIYVGTVGTTSTITVYDNTAASGTVILSTTSVAEKSIPLDVEFFIGLTVVTAGAAAANITVVYR